MKPIQGRLESVSKLSKKLKTELDRYSAQKTQEVFLNPWEIPYGSAKRSYTDKTSAPTQF